MPYQPRIYGLLGEFEEPDRLLAAARAAHREGYRRIEAYTPFPVHGLAAALGHPRTRLPLVVLIGGIIGCTGGFFLQWYTAVIDYPLNVGGRPLNSWPAFIIITFELTILCAALSAVLGMLAMNRLPQPYHPLFNVAEFELASRTHFFLCIEATDRKFDAAQARDFLQRAGATKVSVVPLGQLLEQPSPATPMPPPEVEPGSGSGAGWPARVIALLACSVALHLAGCDNVNGKMDDESRVETYEPSSFFPDGQSVRPLVEGTVARGQANLDAHYYTGMIDGREADTFPFPISRQTLWRGREQYMIHCAVCHNASGDGNGMVVRRGFVPPPSFHTDKLRSAPPGHFFYVITNGWGAMYDYNDRVKVEDRWAISAYIRVLQLSQSADLAMLTPEDRQKLEQSTTPQTQPAQGSEEAHQ